MTDKQKEKIRDKIKKVKQTLAAEKRKFGGFDDSRGLRYVPTGLYVKIGDFDGGLKYLKWFEKNFPNDIGFPGFLFESTVILFKAGNLRKQKLNSHFTATCDKPFISNRAIVNPFQKRPYLDQALNSP